MTGGSERMHNDGLLDVSLCLVAENEGRQAAMEVAAAARNAVRARFSRFLGEPLLEHLAAEAQKDGWWADLLASRFRDSDGVERPLILAVRGGYLNAYVEGQSVLNIRFDAKSPAKIRAILHHKYLAPDATGQAYLAFDGHRVVNRNGSTVETYAGRSSLDRWIRNAQQFAKPKAAANIGEKQGVAIIAGQHRNVIDVEMALPPNPGSPRVANRLDMVTLERQGDRLRIVFYEAKTFDNKGSLRAAKGVGTVVAQLQAYEDWMKGAGRAEEVVAGYRNVCRLLQQINDMRSPSDRQVLHPHIFEAARPDTPLALDPKPRLIVFGYSEAQRDQYWMVHENALRAEGIDGVRLVMAPRAGDVVIPEATSQP